MKLKTIWTAALCLGLVALGGDRLAAADKAQAPAQQELRAKMAAQDWKEISLGVFERQRGKNKVEHLGYGREGLVWTIGELTRQHDALMKEYQRHPSEDLHKVIDRLSVKIADAKRELRNTKDLSSVSEAVASGCNICYGATADAYPLSGSSGQGVGAIADANFSSSCGNIGDTYAYAYVRATLNGTTVTHTVEDPHTGSSVISHAASNVNGTSDCLSSASSFAQSTELGISYSASQSNSSCPPPPLPTPTITGPATSTINGNGCKTLTWSATESGGTPPYSFSWIIDGIPAGTNNPVSKTYCGDNTAHSQTVNVAVTVTDAATPTQTASSSSTTTITYTAIPLLATTINGLATATITGAGCKTFTWSSTTSGGTTPYSYAWTINGVATGTSSSTSVSKSYCGNNTVHSQSVNVALTVTDATNPSQTASGSFTTTINYALPLAISISSTTPVAISGVNCKTITWTSTVSGGTSPYSYAWMIDNVGAGSASSISKTYCGTNTTGTQTVNVSLTVTDAASQTGTVTYTTTINYSAFASGG